MRHHEQHHEGPWRSEDEFERANSDQRGERGRSEDAARGMGFGPDPALPRRPREPWDEEWAADDRFGAAGRDLRGDRDIRGGYRGSRSYESHFRTQRPGWQGYEGITPRGSHAGKGPRGYQRTDERIWEDVCERLSSDPDVDASDIDVAVKDGDVVLSGTVDSKRSKRAAEDIVESVHGVKDVQNTLRVHSVTTPDHPAASAPPPVIEGYTAGATDGSRRTHGGTDAGDQQPRNR